jgi:hypothetical protein
MAVEWVEYDLSTELTRPPLNRRGWHPQWRGGHSDRDKRKT